MPEIVELKEPRVGPLRLKVRSCYGVFAPSHSRLSGFLSCCQPPQASSYTDTRVLVGFQGSEPPPQRL